MTGWDLPNVINPPATVCVQLAVPDDPAYLSAFWGAILDLTVGFNWANDAAHTAKLAAARMRKMYLDAQLDNCSVSPVCPPQGGVGVDPIMIRQDPDNPCLLQTSIDGINWCTFADLSKCLEPLQPGPGGPKPPPPGLCAEYNISFVASQVALVPATVSAGDTIRVLKQGGAGSDGTLNFFCLDGEFFIAGACVGGAGHSAGDPLATTPHMALIMQIAGVYYPLTTSLFTVPGGVSNAQIYIQVNDGTLVDNSGSYVLVVEVCNHQTPSMPWCWDQDMRLTPQGWNPDSGVGALTCPGPYNGTLGNWVSGSGWQGQVLEATDGVGPHGCASDYAYLAVDLDLGILTNFSADAKGVNVGSFQASDTSYVIAGTDPAFGAGTYEFLYGPASPAAGAFSYSGSTTMPRRYVRVGIIFGGNGTGTGNQTILTEVKFVGTGDNPFGSSNC